MWPRITGLLALRGDYSWLWMGNTHGFETIINLSPFFTWNIDYQNWYDVLGTILFVGMRHTLWPVATQNCRPPGVEWEYTWPWMETSILGLETIIKHVLFTTWNIHYQNWLDIWVVRHRSRLVASHNYNYWYLLIWTNWLLLGLHSKQKKLRIYCQRFDTRVLTFCYTLPSVHVVRQCQRISQQNNVSAL